MLKITHEAPLRPLNTMGIEGSVDALVEWETADDLRQLFTDPAYAELVKKPVKAIGGGSNLLFTRYRHEGVLVKCVNRSILSSIATGYTVVETVAAGCVLDDYIADTCRRGLWGAEQLSLIPGTIGGAAIQNAGAYGTDMSHIVKAVHCYDREHNEQVTLAADDIAYGYRDSALKHEPLASRMIVTAVTVELSRVAPEGATSSPSQRREEVVAIRRAKLPDPAETGSAGSYFKNPVVTYQAYRELLSIAERLDYNPERVPAYPTTFPDGTPAIKLSAAWLIDQSGWRGQRRWNVGTWPSQALVIVNTTGYASAIEVLALAHDIAVDVQAIWGIALEPEVEYL